MSEAAVIAVREETARIGNTKVTKKTAFVATAEGLVAIESHSVEQLNQQPRIAPAPRLAPALPAPPPPTTVIIRQRAPEYSWYDPHGKDCFVAFLLILMWIVIAVVTLPLFILCCICYYCFCNDDD